MIAPSPSPTKVYTHTLYWVYYNTPCLTVYICLQESSDCVYFTCENNFVRPNLIPLSPMNNFLPHTLPQICRLVGVLLWCICYSILLVSVQVIRYAASTVSYGRLLLLQHNMHTATIYEWIGVLSNWNTCCTLKRGGSYLSNFTS